MMEASILLKSISDHYRPNKNRADNCPIYSLSRMLAGMCFCNNLTLNMLMANSTDDKLMLCQIEFDISNKLSPDNVHEMSNSVFLENFKNINLSSAEIFT